MLGRRLGDVVDVVVSVRVSELLRGLVRYFGEDEGGEGGGLRRGGGGALGQDGAVVRYAGTEEASKLVSLHTFSATGEVSGLTRATA